MKKKTPILSVFIIFFCLIIAAVLFIQQRQTQKADTPVHVTKPNSLRPQPVLERSVSKKITIGAIGDILMHDRVYKYAYNGHRYNFDPLFADVKSLLEKPDILTANQESTLGGLELGLSSYPSFNSPHEVADALVHTGVDIVSTANNHSLDKGEKGIDSEAKYLNSIGLPHVGSFIDEEDRKKLRILDKDGIKIAFLAYTFGTNGIPIPDDKDFLVNLINRDIMKDEIHRAKKVADVVVMSIHWGNEYQRFPTDEQKNLAQFLADEGADIIFGSHPHVLQPMDWIKTKDGRKAFVVYSLGNFISGQSGDYKDIGGLATIDISKQASEKGSSITLSNPRFYPTFVSKKKHYKVYPFEKAAPFGLANPEGKYKEIQNHMFQWLR
ncbi:capsular biosynthesis protein [Bacillus sp. MUM 116]|uniref:CapA family protein n=1 Tax=Bacillus sp. MUM 116 TaxID=1678002 RepID=UPI0008F5BC1E|nr:CapA family protein [Bacillus sp. MUM 116]OIK13238.1 capsular biosynthesis protein [Bacillus sp. MUM 116]